MSKLLNASRFGNVFEAPRYMDKVHSTEPYYGPNILSGLRKNSVELLSRLERRVQKAAAIVENPDMTNEQAAEAIKDLISGISKYYLSELDLDVEVLTTPPRF